MSLGINGRNEMEYVKIPNNQETIQCPRCNQSYCPNCINFETVEFEVMDSSEQISNKIQWNGVEVCPWCYNQLVDLKQSKEQ